MTASHDPASPLDTLSLPEIEETAAELHRRIAVALRGLGEQAADTPDIDGAVPRRDVAALCAAMEFTASTFALIAAAAPVEVPRIDRHPAYVAAIMYAAPAVPGLLQRLEQDRRMVIALGRRIESSFDVVVATPWGERTPRRMLTEVLLGDAARCALALERRATTDEA